MRYTLYYILFILLLTASYKINGQESDETIKNKPTGRNYLENLQLITDRDIYVAGEKIWLNTRLQCASEDSSGCLSNILYVDFYRESGPFRMRSKFRINQGKASGSIVIPTDFITGNYYIQVYTNYQKTSLLSDLTRKEILILNPSQKVIAPEEEETVKLFFDGGKPVYGYPAKGVLVINQAAKILRKGILVSNNKDTVCRVKLLNEHLGLFTFTPSLGNNYSLTLHFGTQDSLLLPIDNIATSVISLTIQNHNNYLTATVDPKNRQFDTSAVFYLRNQQMKILLRKKISAGNEPDKIKISYKQLAPGTNYLVLSNSSGKLLCMHSFKLQPKDYIPVELETDKKLYKPGDTVKLTIPSISHKVQLVVCTTIKGSLSAKSEFFPDKESSLANRIIHENEILINKNQLAKLTAGPEPLSTENLPDIRDVSISGIVSNPATGKPLDGNEVYLSALGDEPQLHIYDANEDGSFIFSLDNFKGNKKIFAGTNGKNPANILINNDFLPEYRPPVKFLHFNAASNHLYEKLFINQQVAEHFLNSQALKTGPRFVPQPILSQPDYSIVLDDFIPLASLEDVFKEIVPNTYLTKRKGSYHFQIKTPGQIKIIDDPMILLDNIPVFDYNQLLEIPPSSVEIINIINQEYFLGAHKLNGVINVITNSSALENYKFPAGSVFFNYQTLIPESKFEAPTPLENNKVVNSTPWFANLLYWNADVEIENNPVNLSFKTADNEGEYEIRVTGFTSSGVPVYGKTTIKVER